MGGGGAVSYRAARRASPAGCRRGSTGDAVRAKDDGQHGRRSQRADERDAVSRSRISRQLAANVARVDRRLWLEQHRQYFLVGNRRMHAVRHDKKLPLLHPFRPVSEFDKQPTLQHDSEDELFFVLKGRRLIEFTNRSEWVEEGQFLIVPHGVRHLPVADEEVLAMLFEPKTTVNTGDVRSELDERDAGIHLVGRPGRSRHLKARPPEPLVPDGPAGAQHAPRTPRSATKSPV